MFSRIHLFAIAASTVVSFVGCGGAKLTSSGSVTNRGNGTHGGEKAFGSSGNTGCAGASCNAVLIGLLDPSRTTNWNPGIIADTQLNLPLGSDGLPVRTKVCASPSPGGDINAAIKSCPEGQVVQLAAGKYTISSTLNITKGIVLRGAGSMGEGGTTIVMTGHASVIQIGTQRDAVCYGNAMSPAIGLHQNAEKESTVIHVGSEASRFSAGDMALIDQVDDSGVQQANCSFFKRVSQRSISERVEIAAVNAASGTLTLATPLHWTFQSASPYLAQIARVPESSIKWVGIEGVLLKGGSNPGYDGQMAGGIDISNAEYCWIKDVQTDASIGGMHVRIAGSHRCVVRDSNFHHSANYGFARDCYGVVLSCGTSDTLVENNIVRYMNKPIQFAVSGGGNVVSYNYADNAWATPGVQETCIDTHCCFPHMELVEGNYAPHIATPSDGVGNSGYLTYFRNYSSSQFAPPVLADSTQKQTGNVAAFHFGQGAINMTVVGNVLGSTAATDLGTALLSNTYVCEGTSDTTGCIFQFETNGKSNVSYLTLWSHGNYDTVNKSVIWNPSITARTLPASLYLAKKPAWWPTGSAWPWAGPDLSPMVGTLPAKMRSDALAK